MRRDIGGVLLILIGGAVLRITIAGTYLYYVKESTRPWLLISGVVLVALGLWSLVDVLRHPDSHGHAEAVARTDADHPDHVPHDDVAGTGGGDAHDGGTASDGHDGHVHPGSKAAWLLLLPVLTIFLVAPPALGAFTAERSAASIAPPADGDAPPALPSGNPVPDLLSDYAARAVWDNGRTLVGHTVSLVGFATPAKGGWYLTRLSLTCCAADAVTVKILTVDPPSTPAPNTWVQVVGQWVPGGGTQSETAIPWVKVSSMTTIAAPKDPYE